MSTLLNVEDLEDQILARLQLAVTDGVISWAGTVGDESEVLVKASALPAIAVLFRRGYFSAPHAVDTTRQTGIVDWSIFALGKNLRERGLGAGRLGATGAYNSVKVAIQYLMGLEMITEGGTQGFPLYLVSYDLAALDPASGKAMYELLFRHEWELVEHDRDDQ